MYGLPDTLRPLSAAEEQVMLAVWACPGAAARRDISQKLKATGWAAATVTKGN
jgi:predicted transcriptional regulator